MESISSWSIRNYLKLLVAVFLFLIQINYVFAQEKAIPKKNKELVVNPIREEVQRYIGYEDLFYRFMTLPYDVTMNSNVQGIFLDIGFLFLILFPVLFFTAKIHIVEKWIIGCLLGFITVVAIPINYCTITQISLERLPSFIDEQLTFGRDNWWTLKFLTLKLTKLFGIIFSSLSNRLGPAIGATDYITLPFLILAFIWTLYIIHKATISLDKGLRAIILFISIYGFLWFFLSAGIVWYGILFLPISIAIFFISLRNENQLTKYLVFGLTSIWLILSFNFRLTNYLPNSEYSVKGIIDKNTLLYQSGKLDKNAYVDEFFPDYSAAKEIINQEDSSSVYMVNTMLPYFITKSDSRIINDGQLSAFVTLVRLFPKKKDLAGALKMYKVKYIVFGLNTNEIDRTPEQSLAAKYDRFLEFLDDNEYLELLVTDRTILNDEGEKVKGVFGKQVINFGTFALYGIK